MNRKRKATKEEEGKDGNEIDAKRVKVEENSNMDVDDDDDEDFSFEDLPLTCCFDIFRFYLLEDHQRLRHVSTLITERHNLYMWHMYKKWLQEHESTLNEMQKTTYTVLEMIKNMFEMFHLEGLFFNSFLFLANSRDMWEFTQPPVKQFLLNVLNRLQNEVDEENRKSVSLMLILLQIRLMALIEGVQLETQRLSESQLKLALRMNNIVLRPRQKNTDYFKRGYLIVCLVHLKLGDLGIHDSCYRVLFLGRDMLIYRVEELSETFVDITITGSDGLLNAITEFIEKPDEVKPTWPCSPVFDVSLYVTAKSKNDQYYCFKCEFSSA